MTIPSKIAGGLSIVSCVRDIHKTAVYYANKQYAKSGSDAFISHSIGAQKTDKLSYKDANRKNWLQSHDFTMGIHETLGRVSGYMKGFAQGVVSYLPNFVLSALAIIPKGNTKAGKLVGNLSAVGLLGLEAYDFIRNSTNLFQRTDYLKK